MMTKITRIKVKLNGAPARLKPGVSFGAESRPDPITSRGNVGTVLRRRDKFVARQGQSILEYVLIIAVVVAALTAMSVYVQRSIQANLRMIEKQINAEPQ